MKSNLHGAFFELLMQLNKVETELLLHFSIEIVFMTFYCACALLMQVVSIDLCAFEIVQY